MSKTRRKQQQTTTPAEQAHQMSMTGGQSMPDGSVQHGNDAYRARKAPEDDSMGATLGRFASDAMDTAKGKAGEAWNGLTGAFGLDGESDQDTGTENDAPGVRG